MYTTTESHSSSSSSSSSSYGDDQQRSASPPSPSLVFLRYHVSLAKPIPFLMPDPFHPNRTVEVLPPPKKTTSIRWDEEILVQEIEDRSAIINYPNNEDEESYEIEIVDDDGDADFYVEIVDGEVFYVFETEDDISLEDDGEYMYMRGSESEDEADKELQLSSNSDRALQVVEPNISNMSAPNLQDEDEPPVYSESFNESIGQLSYDAEEDDGKLDTPKIRVVSPMEEAHSNAQLANKRAASRVAPVELSNSAAIDSSTDRLLSMEQRGKEVLAPTNESGSNPLLNASHLVNNLIAPPSPSQFDSPVGVKSILKACPDSLQTSKVPKKTKPKKSNGQKTEKSYTKTYVRVETFDGEHQVYGWQKPDWADSKKAPKLKETGKGNALRQGQNLASPITNLPALKGVGKNQSMLINADGTIDQEAVLAKLKSGNPFLRFKNLKMSSKGSMIRSGKDIVKPITMATQNREHEQINKVADPKKLRSSEVGKAVKEGKTLALPTTAATQIKQYEFAKPDWAVQRSMKQTQNGELLKQGIDVTAPITHIRNNRSSDDAIDCERTGFLSRTALAEKKKIMWEKPEWAVKPVLKESLQGEAVKKGVSLSKPITSLPDDVKRARQPSSA